VGIVTVSAVERVAGSDDEGVDQVAGLGWRDERKLPNKERAGRTSQTMRRSPGATCLFVDHI